MKARLPLIAAFAVALSPLKASAQAWVSNPDFSEGVGIRAGNLELHPSAGAEFGYDSNFLRTSGNGPGERIVDALKLRITPSLTLSTLGSERRNSATPPSVAFTAGAYASYSELFPLASENDAVRERRAVGLGADAKLDIFPKGKVGADLGVGFARTIDTEGRADDLAGEGFNRDTVRGGGGLTWRPGGGLFEWRAGYELTYNIFEDDAFSQLANIHHEVGTRGRWRFLPRSALLFDSTYTFTRYTGNTVQTDGDAIRSRIGLHGLVTYHLALMGMLGWASSFYKAHDGSITPRQFDSPIANAEVRWFIQARPNLDDATVASGISSVALGYIRSFKNSYYGSFYQRDRGYLQFSTFLLGAIAGGLEFGLSRVHFPDVNGAAEVNQLRIDGNLFAEYRFTDTVAANATLQFDKVNSPNVGGEDLDYTRWQAYVGVRWFM